MRVVMATVLSRPTQADSCKLFMTGLLLSYNRFQTVVDAAVAAFCLEVIARHGEPAERLCNKDPLTLKAADYLSTLFPNSKFIFMVRDGRATVHSIISRKVTITGFDLSDYKQCMTKWNEAIKTMYEKCLSVGRSRCMIVYYEQLVLHPGQWLKKILEFLDIEWNEAVLHHEDHINEPGGVLLSKVERSSDQVIKPVNVEALTKWVGQFPKDVVKNMATIAPMLSKLGYDPTANPPFYGEPDSIVKDNTRNVKEKAKDILRPFSSKIDDKQQPTNATGIDEILAIREKLRPWARTDQQKRKTNRTSHLRERNYGKIGVLSSERDGLAVQFQVIRLLLSRFTHSEYQYTAERAISLSEFRTIYLKHRFETSSDPSYQSLVSTPTSFTSTQRATQFQIMPRSYAYIGSRMIDSYRNTQSINLK
ncbi:unnamed protein product [Nesidiocoris tenuis]|uniref:Protein-tyrosine sulfotransferase n=1 Tax=Nesidiocoris tenuis TaxID=355587 RepID=A0A6H5GDS4_9HEMI|nr:unnamed protein product [Nesidiocoris tenuis]